MRTEREASVAATRDVVEGMLTQLNLTVLATLATVVIAGIAAYFAFLQARSAAKPRVVISLLDERRFAPGQEARITINLRNRPYFYAAPTASDVCAYVNVDPVVQPLRLRFGSMLPNADAAVKVGKDNSRYLKATGIVLLPNQSENIEFDAVMPTIEGRYRIWVDVRTAEGASATVHMFLDVRG